MGRMGNWIKEIVRGERWDGLFVRLCWMTLVIAAIYGVQNSPLGEDWRTAIGEGIGIFGGVELILDKINDLRHRRTIAESQAKAEREAAKAQQETARADQEAAKAQQEAAKAQQADAKTQQEAARADQEAAKVQQEALRADREAFRADVAEREGALRAEREALRADTAEREAAELRRRVAELERQANGANHKE